MKIMNGNGIFTFGGASRSIGDMAHFFFFIYKFPIQGSRARKSINFIVFEVVCKRVMISA